MRINLTRFAEIKQSVPLWTDSPCCHNYQMGNPSIDLAQRFKIGSIYYRDQVDKQKQVFDQIQKPDLLLQDFRKKIQEAGHQKHNTAGKKSQLREKERNRARSLAVSLPNKFYEVPTPNQYLYDRGGFRSHMPGHYDVKQIQTQVMTARRSFSSGRRTDLARPLNFYPGPGSYQIEIPPINTEQVRSARYTDVDMKGRSLSKNNSKELRSSRYSKMLNEEACSHDY